MASKAPPGLPRKPTSVPPNQTLYINHLNTRLRKDDLRRELYMLFSTYGTVLDVNALKTQKMRGQAHVTFKNIESATQAMRNLQDFEFFGDAMNIQYAKGKSDLVAKLDGTFKMPVPEGREPTPPAADGTGMTALQASIFNAPPSGATSEKPAESTALKLKPIPNANATNAAAAGTKRSREEEEEEAEQSDQPMDEDSDAMQESDDD